MKELLSSFDSYNFRARISVSFLLVAPWLIELYIFVPQIRELPTTIVVLLVAYAFCNIAIAYTHLTDEKVTKRAFPELMPTTRLLMPSNTAIDKVTKDRYYHFFNDNMFFPLSGSDAEMKAPIESAIRWLISQTRDKAKFPLIYEENINYGVAKNLYGLKKHGILLSMLGIATNAVIWLILYFDLLKLDISYISIFISAVTHILFILFWIFIARIGLVRICGEKYARVLLSACDSPFLKRDR